MPLVIVALGVLFLLLLIIFKVKPFYSLLITALAVGLAEGMNFIKVLSSIFNGFLSTLETMAIVLLLGAMLGKMIETSGAAQRITLTLSRWFGIQNIQWAVMLTGLMVGIPLFYNAGFVILVPLIFAISASAKVPLLYVGIPMAAALSVTHGYLPPHPGPTAIASIFHADMGRTLLYGLIISIPAVILAGPIFSWTIRGLKTSLEGAKVFAKPRDESTLPPAGVSLIIALFPVFLIALNAILDAVLPTFLSAEKWKLLQPFIKTIGNPMAALAIALGLAVYILGSRHGSTMNSISKELVQAVKDILMIILIIASGGSFKQVLVDAGVGTYIKEITVGLPYSPLFLGWFIAALLRVSIGSATVAGLTAAGIVLPLLSIPGVKPELMVLAVGAGSLMFSHVNDTGFWMFKEYFNLSLKNTFLSWSLMETIISVAGLAGVLVLNQFIH